MSHHEHRADAPPSVKIFVVTASDTRTESEDQSGAFLSASAAKEGHAVVGYRLVKDEPDQIRAALEAAAGSGAEAVLVNGGTGIAGRDRTFEAVAGLLEKRIDGFGELFRMLSYQDIGSAAMMSRAVAGVWRGMALFSMPGSLAAVKLAWKKLVGPELSHVIRELRKDAPPARR